MKKIYFLWAALFFSGTSVAQSVFNAPENPFEKASLPAGAKPPLSATADPSRTLGPKYWIEPVGDVMTNFGIDLSGASSGSSQGTFLSVINDDSTVNLSSSFGTRPVSNIMLGSVLDPKSPNLLPGFTPFLSQTDAYSIDSLQIIGSYVKVTPETDTLYVWLVWGDTSNISVYSKRTNSSIWVAPINTWRSTIIGPKVSGFTGAAGNKVKASAPAANKILVKYVLTSADEATGAGYSNVISIALPYPANIPAGNVASCFYTFVPGGTHTLGDCSYSFTGAPDPQVVNGFAGMIWQQTSPAVSTVADYQNMQVDPDSWCMATSYFSKQRHIVYPASYDNSLWGNLTTAPLIYYSVYSNTSVGINEEDNNFSLGQNRPNPFSGDSRVDYYLKAAAKNVSLEVYDIAGVKVFGRTQTDTSAGRYSVVLNSNDFPAGVYFYSLTVDGKRATRKMVIAK